MNEFADQLTNWYADHQRDLPWRNTQDPYRIWLSEMILQQTRVAQGLPYYTRFVEALPTVQAFAAASQEQVLRLWQGLGYYSRARYMHATARVIVDDYAGNFPDNFQTLKTLKGIGDYTAAAIASFAFGERVAVVDGNVYRVLARVFGKSEDISAHQGKKVFAQLAQELIQHAESPSTYNQAIMEFGATHCTPKQPQCGTCPFRGTCVAFAGGLQAQLPHKTKKTKVKDRYFHYLVFWHEGKYAMRLRQGGDIWEGLYDFFLYEAQQWSRPEQIEVPVDGRWRDPSPIFKHLLTHQRLQARFWIIEVEQAQAQVLAQTHGLRFFDLAGVEALPKPVLIKKYLDNLKISLF
ncbi:MAG: A/G-specific adenine glycosylase [Bernardetiaceae bacterium]